MTDVISQLGLLLPFAAIAAVVLISRIMSSRELNRRVESVIRGERTTGQRGSRELVVSSLAKVGTFVQRLSVLSDRDMKELARTARSAGLSPDTAVPLVIGGKLILMLACPAAAYILSSGMGAPWPLVLTCMGVAVGLFGPNAAINYLRNVRTKALRLGLSDALDLLVVCAEAGLGLESAIDRVASEMKASNPEVSEEFTVLGQDLRLSADRGAALIRMGERTGLDSFQRLTSTLAQTLRYGTPLGQALRLLAAEMRNDRLLRLEEKAARLPTLLTIPLAAFILPCLFIVVAGPAALRVFRMMH